MSRRFAIAALLFVVAGARAAAQIADEAPGMPEMATHRIEEPVFNGQIAVYEAGRGQARAILLVHGIGENGARDFSDHIAWLRKSFHVVAVDLPGFGRSDRSNALYSPANYAGVLKHVADRYLQGRPFVLVGHSLGGVVALRYAAAHPAEVDKLVVISVPGVLHRHATTSRYLAGVMGISRSEFNELGWLSRLPGKLLTPFERLGADPQAVLVDPELRKRVLGADPEQIAGLAVVNDDLSLVLPEVRAETLVVWGAEDEIAPLRIGRVLERKLPRAQLELIPGAGHVPMQDTPGSFRAVVESFLEHGLPPAGVASAPPRQNGAGRCRRERGRVFEGDYDRLLLENCQQVLIRNARVRELRIVGSTVTIDDSHLGGGKTGMLVRGSTVMMTGGRIEGDVAISAYGSRLDLAAVEVEGRNAAVRASRRSYFVFSLSRLKSPYTDGEVHDFYAVTAENPR